MEATAFDPLNAPPPSLSLPLSPLLFFIQNTSKST